MTTSRSGSGSGIGIRKRESKAAEHSGRVEIFEVRGLEELRETARAFTGRLSDKQIILLNGPMGSGKTQFTRYLLEALECMETVSPSFAIHNRYDTCLGPVDHIDLFRLDGQDGDEDRDRISELESTGFWDLFAAPDGLIIIEWAERLPAGSLPMGWSRIELTLEIVGPDSRRLLCRQFGAR